MKFSIRDLLGLLCAMLRQLCAIARYLLCQRFLCVTLASGVTLVWTLVHPEKS